MKAKITAMLPGLIVASVVGIALVAVSPHRADAAAKSDTKKSQSDTKKKSDTSNKKDTKDSSASSKSQKTTQKSTAAKNYTYTAQSGDSYTLFARKAIEAYAQQQKLTISQNRIIYAETNLTIAAGSPYLNLGQQQTLSAATVKSWVTKATNLSDAQAALWNVYVPTVNFDVSHVGQAG